MPLYVYKCIRCGWLTDIRHKHDEKPEVRCAECGGILRKKILPPVIHFKGTGFYSTTDGDGEKI